MIRKKRTEGVDEQMVIRNFRLLMDFMRENGYQHYEISNFCKDDAFSKHNRSYWSGEKYLGIGPSAHSFDTRSRQWNVSNIPEYIEAVEKGIIPAEKEPLTETQKYNEYIMTSLRTMWGIDYHKLRTNFGEESARYFSENVQKYIHDQTIVELEGLYFLTDDGKLFADGIASDLFL